MRVARVLALIAAACTPLFCFSQANWTPTTPPPDANQPRRELSALKGVSVRQVILSPEDALAHYHIQIAAAQPFIMVDNVEMQPSSYHYSGYGSLKVGDLIDAIITPGATPEHGQVKSTANFDASVILCSPGCLVFARHKDNGEMSDIIQYGELHPKFFSNDGKHVCDRQSHFVYIAGFDARPGYQSYNWLPPTSYDLFCLPTSQNAVVQTYVPAASPNSVEQEIAAIRKAPHAAMPPAQSSQASLGGQTDMTIDNGTNYILYFYLSGANNQALQIAAHSSQTLSVPPGNYEIAAKVSDPSVMPFYGTDMYAPNSQYSHHFYISTQPR